MHLVLLVSVAVVVTGSRPDSCFRFDETIRKLQELKSLQQEQDDISQKRSDDIRKTQARIGALMSARIPLLPGKASTNRNLKQVAHWFEAALVEIIESTETENLSPAIVNFVNAQDESFGPFLGHLLTEMISIHESHIYALAQSRDMHQKSAQTYSSRITALSPGAAYLLNLCLRDMEEQIRRMAVENQAPSRLVLESLRAKWHRYLAFSV